MPSESWRQFYPAYLASWKMVPLVGTKRNIALAVASAEYAWQQFGKPYVKVYPQFVDYFRFTELDVPFKYLRSPLPVISILLPEAEQMSCLVCFVENRLICTSSYGGSVTRWVGVLPTDNEEQTIENAINIDVRSAMVRAGDHTEEEIAASLELGRQQLQIIVSTILFLNNGNRIVLDNSSPVQPEVITRDLPKYRIADDNTKARLVQTAIKRGKYGWSIGREQVLPSRPTTATASEGHRAPLSHQFLRRGHFRVQRFGARRSQERVIFIYPTVVRPDLPPRGGPSRGYRISGRSR